MNWKMPGFAGFAAVALTVLAIGAGSANATELTCTNPPLTKVMCTPGTVIKATSTHIVFHPPVGEITCEHSLFEAKITNTGTSTETIKGEVTSFDFTNCGDWTVTVIAKGGLELHTHESDSPGKSGWGTLTLTGTEITVEDKNKIHCIFKASNTDFATITGSTTTGREALMDPSGKKLPRVGGRSGVFCGSEAELTGSYTITNPSWLDVDHAFL